MGSLFQRVRRRAGRDQRGQALVEFALLAPLFFMLVIGVIQFAVALNFWFDLHRLANQGARSAAVNCGPAAANQCGPTTLFKYLGPLTDSTPEGQVISRGNTLFGGNDPAPTADTADAEPYGTRSAEICYVPPTSDFSEPPLDADGNPWKPSAGDAIRVTLKDRYRLQAIVNLAKIDLTARATMRLEVDPTSPALPDRTDKKNWVLKDNPEGTCRP